MRQTVRTVTVRSAGRGRQRLLPSLVALLVIVSACGGSDAAPSNRGAEYGRCAFHHDNRCRSDIHVRHDNRLDHLDDVHDGHLDHLAGADDDRSDSGRRMSDVRRSAR
jgi:hypothetical protein